MAEDQTGVPGPESSVQAAPAPPAPEAAAAADTPAAPLLVQVVTEVHLTQDVPRGFLGEVVSEMSKGLNPAPSDSGLVEK